MGVRSSLTSSRDSSAIALELLMVEMEEVLRLPPPEIEEKSEMPESVDSFRLL